jgi:serine/threonine protein kinase
VFEKVNGGPLLTRIQEHIHFTEREASQIIGDLASALQFLHVKGEIWHFKDVLRDVFKKFPKFVYKSVVHWSRWAFE